MPNYNVNYIRSNRSLLTLQAELRARFGGREQNKGFVSGYGKGNLTGHNADNNGVTHAYDIGVDIEGDGSGLTPADGLWLAEHLRQLGASGFAPLRAGYVIHDMSTTTTPAPRIAGAFNGWVWQLYSGSSPHSDHIHLSTVDLLWGDVAGVPASVYDSTQSWGVQVMAVTPKPTPAVVTPAKASELPLVWIVDPGNTLSGIAAHYGGTVEDFKAINGLTSDTIHPGQVLLVPTPVSWTVDPGDSLGYIAGVLGTSVADIAGRNGLHPPYTIHPGQVLVIRP